MSDESQPQNAPQEMEEIQDIKKRIEKMADLAGALNLIGWADGLLQYAETLDMLSYALIGQYREAPATLALRVDENGEVWLKVRVPLQGITADATKKLSEPLEFEFKTELTKKHIQELYLKISKHALVYSTLHLDYIADKLYDLIDDIETLKKIFKTDKP